jgi:hypothetical protein
MRALTSHARESSTTPSSKRYMPSELMRRSTGLSQNPSIALSGKSMAQGFSDVRARAIGCA